ncbi:RNase adapter RapZ [Streptomyces sp. NRRL B-24484]|uniref:RapZ C-terminal domain-containing protein n=1 Tax=Streptomyces sp. NRRL B-24484 TaxID=1463833 RepID=UPI0004C11D1E|nr:RNase adapter RapZ [Streptomyces sp. NRRL B-24484]
MTDALIQVGIETIGTLHPEALGLIRDGLYFDLGGQFRNPHHDPAMRYRTGLDPEVREHVLTTPGVMPMVERIAESAKAVHRAYADPRHLLVNVTIACRGGRHRSVAVAEAVAAYLRTDGIGVEVHHRHIDRPVIENQAD